MPRPSAPLLNEQGPPDPMSRPLIVGIVNITADSFSDGGRFLDRQVAASHARQLKADGADIIELGAAASNIAADPVPPDEEIDRLDGVITDLAGSVAPLAIDSFEPEVQRFALSRGVGYLNDIKGFPDSGLYSALATSACHLVVMHGVAVDRRAQRVNLGPNDVWRHIEAFFKQRIARLEAAGVVRERLILDPGMGFFLSERPEASLRVLANIGRLKAAFGLPVMVSVSRKSFLGSITGRQRPDERGAATLAAELYAAMHGADYIRTHDPAALRDGLAVMEALATA
jgi:dihydropteroate synthase type 2